MRDKYSKELVSIVVTSFNHSSYLDIRMKSLLKQTYENFEIIIIDDCSTDDSVQILKKYTDIKKVRLIALTENIGYANATNLGVDMAKGEFVMIAESDDYNDPMHIEILHNVIKDNPDVGAAYCRSKIVNANGNVISNDFANREFSFKKQCFSDTKILGKEMLKYLLISCVIPNLSAALIRKSIFHKIKGLSSEYKACSDWDFWFRMSYECNFYYISRPLNNFRIHPSSHISLSALELLLKDIIKLLYIALNRNDFSFKEKVRFRLNVGTIVASYFKRSPIKWIKKLPGILRDCSKYDKAIFFFVLLGLLKLIINKVINLLVKLNIFAKSVAI